MRIKLMVGLGVIALSSLAAGCSDSGTTTNTNANTTTVATTTTSNTTTQPTTTAAPGDSEITKTTDASGVTTETRTFRNNTRVSRVVVTTTREGKRTARVYPVSGEPRDLPEDRVGRALEDTGDAIADAAGFVANKTTETAAAAKEGAQAVGDKTAEAAKTAGQKTAEGARTVGEATAAGAKTAGQKTAEGAKKAGKAVKDAVTP